MARGDRGRTEERKSYAETVAEKIIEQLEQGVAPWQKPWKPGELQQPYNATTGNPYRGFNSVWLHMQGYEDPRWVTYKQSQALGAQVRKGEKGTLLQYVAFEGRENVLGPDGSPVIGDDGKPRTQLVRYETPRRFAFVVFNAQQIDGMPPREVTPRPEWERHAAAESILSAAVASGIDMQHQRGNRAYYQPALDRIVMPERDQFDTADGYYATALHELGHATGHPSRLNRDLAHPFGSEGYAKEELRAEIASLMLGERLGIGHDPGQHAAYVGSWVKALREDPREILRAAADAEKIATFVTGLEQQHAKTADLAPLASIALESALTDPRLSPYADAAPALSTARISSVLDLYGSDRQNAETHAFDALASAFTVDREGDRRAFASAVVAIAEEHLERVHDRGAKLERTAVLDAEPTQAPAATADQDPAMQTPNGRTYLRVPYSEKEDAKSHGARWDKQARSWYADTTDPAKLAPFAKWMPDSAPRPSQSPQEEFADALRAQGFQLDGLPVMDGTRQRVAVEGDKGKETSGMYIGFSDGHPAGHIENFRTGYKANWKSQQATDTLSDADRARLAEEAATRRAERTAVEAAKYERTAAAVGEFLSMCAPAPATHPYIARKQVDPAGALQVPDDPALTPPGSLVRIAATPGEAADMRQAHPETTVVVAGSLVIPAHGPDGRLQTMQTIAASGWKGNATGGKLEGAAAVFKGTDESANAPIIVCEGWATGKTLHAAGQGRAEVRAAFSANNLLAVAAAVRAEHPERPIIIAGDNDHRRAAEIDPRTGLPKGNPGKDKAEEAAKAVGGYAALPGFAKTSKGSDWNDYAAEKGLDAVTEALNEARLLADRRRLSDARMFGHDGERVEEQIRQSQAAVEAPAEKQQQTVQRTDQRAAYVGLREAANREAEHQDKSDELQEQDTAQPEPEQQHQQRQSRGRGRSRSR